MRLKSIQDPPSIAKSLICALVTFLVMSMVTAEAMEPQAEARSLKPIEPHLSTNITSDYTNKSRERRLTHLFKDEIIELASKLGTDLSQVEEETPALQKYERYFEVIRDFPSFLKENDLKESSSKEVIEILLRHVDGDAALVSDLGFLDNEKADELMSLLLSKWKEHGVTLEDALERLMLGKSVDDFLDSDLINVWRYFGTLLTGVSGVPALRSMLKVLSEKFGVRYLADALVVRHTAGKNSMGGRLYRQQLLVWNRENQLSQEEFYKYFAVDSLGLSIWMDFVLLRAPYDPNPSSYRIEVLEWLNKKKETPIRDLTEKESDIKELMNDRLINKKLMITVVMKKEVMIKRLTNKKLMTEELKYKESTNEQLMILNNELMNDESMSKSLLKKELMNRKSMIEDLVKKESMIEDLMKEESKIEDLMKEELKKMDSIFEDLWFEKLVDDKFKMIEDVTVERAKQKNIIEDLMKEELTNKELMNKELMNKESMKEELKKLELRIKELINEKLINDALMHVEVIEERIKQDAIIEKLMNEGFTSEELMNKELKSMQELIKKEVMIKKLINNDVMMEDWMKQESTEKELRDKKLVNEGLTSTEMRNNELLKEELRNKDNISKDIANQVLMIKEMQKWQGLLGGGTWRDQALEARRLNLIIG